MFSRRNPLFVIAVVFIAGIAAGYHSNIPLQVSEILAAANILLIIVVIIFYKRISDYLKILLVMFSFFILGAFKISYDRDIDTGMVNKISLLNENIILSGIVEETPLLNSSSVSFPVSINKIYPGKECIPVSFKAIFRIHIDSLTKSVKEIDYGDEIFAVGKLFEPRGARNPGEFNYSNYLLLNNISAFFRVGNFNSVIVRSKWNGNYIEQSIIQPVRQYISRSVDEKMGSVEAAFLKGLLIGDRSGIPEEVKDNFLNAGVMHVLAVSGLNVAFVILIFSAFYSIFFTGRLIKTSLIIISLLFYMLLTGSSPSIVRATIMGIVFITGNNLERKTSQMNLLALSAFIILIVDARELFDLGFQLSFLCVFALLYFYPILSGLWKPDSNSKTIKVLKESFWGSLSVLIFLFPVLAMTTGKVSVISVIANLFVVPLANLSLAIGFLQVISGLVSIPVSGLFAATNQFLLWLNLGITKYFGSQSFSFIEVYQFTPFTALIYYVFCFFSVYAVKNKYWPKLIISLFIGINLFIWISFFNGYRDNLRITFLDSGQGDASLLQLPGGKNILIDAGPGGTNFDSGEKIIYPFLKREGINSIDYCFISHFHDDHFGGLPYLIKNGMIKNIFYYDSTGSGSNFCYLDSLSKANKVIFSKIDFSNMDIGDLKICVLGTDDSGKYTNESKSKPPSRNSIENNCSLVMKVYYGNISILFAGDIESEKEMKLTGKYGVMLKSNILKVAHHGSRFSSGEKFLDCVKPEKSVIFAGLGNKFRFPSKAALERLTREGTDIYRTDMEGAVIFETDGNKIKRCIWK